MNDRPISNFQILHITEIFLLVIIMKSPSANQQRLNDICYAIKWYEEPSTAVITVVNGVLCKLKQQLCMYIHCVITIMVNILLEHNHSCVVQTKLYSYSNRVHVMTEFSLDLVSPVEYLFRKFSINEFGKLICDVSLLA